MENPTVQYSESSVAAEQQRFMVRVYNWMTSGLVLTGLVAYAVASTPAVLQLVMNPIVLIVLVIAQLGLVFWLASRVMQMSATQATGVFFSIPRSWESRCRSSFLPILLAR